MNIIEIIIISIGLAMDSSTMAICLGLQIRKNINIKAFKIAFWFALFQAIMPVIGYLLGNTFASLINKIDHFIIFFVLSFVGINMIMEQNEYVVINDEVSLKEIILLSVVTSIDALAVGVTFSFLDVNIKLAFINIGLITFILTLIGCRLGNFIAYKMSKTKLSKYVSAFGGIILILLGTKILLQHLGIIG